MLEDIEDVLDKGDDGSTTQGSPRLTTTRGWTSTITSTVTDNAALSGVGGVKVDTATTTFTTSFDPAQPSEACAAWESLWDYCGGTQGGVACACYSGAWYVPDQWNQLASRCGQYKCTSTATERDAANYCALSKTASDLTSYCSMGSATSVKFGAEPAVVSTTATPTATNGAGVVSGGTSGAAGGQVFDLGLCVFTLLVGVGGGYLAYT